MLMTTLKFKGDGNEIAGMHYQLGGALSGASTRICCN
jgi:hypothetical protein